MICVSCSIELERGELLWNIYKSTIIKNVFGDGYKNNDTNLVSIITNDCLMAVGKDQLNVFKTTKTPKTSKVKVNSDETLKSSPIKMKSKRSQLHAKIPSKCPHCAKLIKNMARHIKEIHERKDASKCQLCPREFARKSSLKDHIRSAHKS